MGVNSIEDYCEMVVMKFGEDARDFIINLTPLVLRVSLEVVYINDPSRAQSVMQNQHYAAKSSDFFSELNDSLNLHTTVLSVLLRTEHYDIIYRRHWTVSFEVCIMRDVDELKRLINEETKEIKEEEPKPVDVAGRRKVARGLLGGSAQETGA